MMRIFGGKSRTNRTDTSLGYDNPHTHLHFNSESRRPVLTLGVCEELDVHCDRCIPCRKKLAALLAMLDTPHRMDR